MSAAPAVIALPQGAPRGRAALTYAAEQTRRVRRPGKGVRGDHRRCGAARMGHGVRADDGSGTVLTLGVVAALLTVLVCVVLLGSAVVAMHRARSAADLAALSAASSLSVASDPGQACRRAQRTASDNHAGLSLCDVVGDDVTVITDVALPAALQRLGLGPARVTAKAGPPRTFPVDADPASSAVQNG